MMIQILPPSTDITLIGPTKRMTLQDVACLFLMALPIAAIMMGGFGGVLFFLFPVGLATLLPAGIIVLTVQLYKRIKKQQFSVLSMFAVVMSLFVVGMGILGWMLLLVVTS